MSDCQSLEQLDNGDNWGAIVPATAGDNVTLLLCLTLLPLLHCKQEHMILSRLRVSLSWIDKSLNRAPKITLSLGTISLELYRSNTDRFFPIFFILIFFLVQTGSYYPSKYGTTIR